jgi:catechol 2,3-dioxygenase-like lactoylglutathione lyase family enzyme
MIQRMSHSAIFVLDQDVAKDFYVNKLGFEVSMDQSMPNGFRWLTVSPKGQSDLQIILMKVAPSPFEGSKRAKNPAPGRRNHRRAHEEGRIRRGSVPNR